MFVFNIILSFSVLRPQLRSQGLWLRHRRRGAANVLNGRSTFFLRSWGKYLSGLEISSICISRISVGLARFQNMFTVDKLRPFFWKILEKKLHFFLLEEVQKWRDGAPRYFFLHAITIYTVEIKEMYFEESRVVIVCAAMTNETYLICACATSVISCYDLPV